MTEATATLDKIECVCVCVENNFVFCANFIFLDHDFIGVNGDFVPEQCPVRGSAGAR